MGTSRLPEILLLLDAQLQVRGPSRRFLRSAVERLHEELAELGLAAGWTPERLETLAKARLWMEMAVAQEAPQASVYRAQALVREALAPERKDTRHPA